MRSNTKIPVKHPEQRTADLALSTNLFTKY